MTIYHEVNAETLLKQLKRIRNPDNRRRALRKAMQAANRVRIARARKEMRRRSGLLAKSLVSKQTYDKATGEMELTIRAKSVRVDGRNPARYLHLVESGAAPHVIRGPVLLHGKVFSNVQHPGAKPRHTLEIADLASRSKAINKFRQTVLRLVYG